MSDTNIKHSEIELDHEGYLADVNEWNESIAVYFAECAGINQLTGKHWSIINYLREKFITRNEIPTIPQLAEESNISVKDFYSLFPNGPLKTSARIAGIKKPKSCI